MKSKHLIAGLVTVAAIGGGTAAAIAATTDDHKATEQAVISDAAKRLGVSAENLRTALGQAEDAQIDAAVKAGKLTQAQADELKQRRKQAGTVLGLGRGGHSGPGFGMRMRGGASMMAEAAKALGISQSTLMQQLRDGKSLESIVKANNKTLDDVKAAVKAAATKQLDADLKAGRLTQAQHDEMADHLDDMVDHLEQLGRFRFGGPGGHRGGTWGGPERP